MNMTELDDKTLKNLQDAFQEVSFRANRLREWMEIDRCLRFLERSFIEFNSEAKKVENGFSAQLPEHLDELWSRCKETDMIDLTSFVAGAKYVNRQSWRGQDGELNSMESVTLMQVIDLSLLNRSVEALDQVLAEKVLGVIPSKSKELRTVVKTKVAEHRHLVNTEVRELCELTIRLRSVFSA